MCYIYLVTDTEMMNDLEQIREAGKQEARKHFNRAIKGLLKKLEVARNKKFGDEITDDEYKHYAYKRELEKLIDQLNITN